MLGEKSHQGSHIYLARVISIHVQLLFHVECVLKPLGSFLFPKQSRRVEHHEGLPQKFCHRFKIFSVLFFKKGFPYGLLQAENIRSARCLRVVLSKLLAARKANFLSLFVLAKNRSARHARECSQRMLVTPR